MTAGTESINTTKSSIVNQTKNPEAEEAKHEFTDKDVEHFVKKEKEWKEKQYDESAIQKYEGFLTRTDNIFEQEYKDFQETSGLFLKKSKQGEVSQEEKEKLTVQWKELQKAKNNFIEWRESVEEFNKDVAVTATGIAVTVATGGNVLVGAAAAAGARTLAEGTDAATTYNQETGEEGSFKDGMNKETFRRAAKDAGTTLLAGVGGNALKGAKLFTGAAQEGSTAIIRNAVTRNAITGGEKDAMSYMYNVATTDQEFSVSELAFKTAQGAGSGIIGGKVGDTIKGAVADKTGELTARALKEVGSKVVKDTTKAISTAAADALDN